LLILDTCEVGEAGGQPALGQAAALGGAQGQEEGRAAPAPGTPVPGVGGAPLFICFGAQPGFFQPQTQNSLSPGFI